MREFVHEPMKTRSSLISSIGVPASNPMYCSARSSPSPAGVGIAAVTGATCAGFVPHETIGLIADGVDDDLLVERARRPRCRARVQAGSTSPPWSRTHANVVSSGAIMPARPPPSIVMLQTVMRPSMVRLCDGGAGELDDVAGGAVDAHLADRGQDEVLGGDARAEVALVADAHGLGLLLDEALRGEDVLDLAGADAEGQRAERAVRRGVRVAADDRHARLGQPQLRPDDVDDALVLGAQRVDGDAELVAVALERLDLRAAERVLDARRDRRAVGRDVVVGGRDRAVRAADRAAGEAQAVERLRARDLVDEVQVDVDEVVGDLVGRPDLVEQGLGHG